MQHAFCKDYLLCDSNCPFDHPSWHRLEELFNETCFGNEEHSWFSKELNTAREVPEASINQIAITNAGTKSNMDSRSFEFNAEHCNISSSNENLSDILR